MTRDEKAAANGIGKPQLEALDLALAKVKGLPDRLTLRDKALILRTWDTPIDVDTLVDVDLHQALWLLHYQLLGVWVDSMDRVWLRTTALGREIVRPEARRRRRA
jgi:hypothetical protein